MRAPATPAETRGLLYPHGDWIPPPGEAAEVAPGVLWARLPLPFGLDHINIYILDAGDHWAVVDTGVRGDVSLALWEQLLAGPLAGKPVGRVIGTHLHPDHIGLAGWLCERFGVTLEMTRSEYLMARVLTLDRAEHTPAPVVDFYTRAGWPEADLDRLRASPWGNFGRGVWPLPGHYRRLQDGDRLSIGGRDWRVVVGSGHSPEHACLVCDAGGLLLAGDQVLPRITSNVSIFATEPDADPLADWLGSITKLRGLPDTLAVFPGHNMPFTRLHTRLDQLDADHARKLDALETFCATPRTAFACFEVLFRRRIAHGELGMATGEALAHLAWLARRGRVTRLPGPANDRFVRAN